MCAVENDLRRLLSMTLFSVSRSAYLRCQNFLLRGRRLPSEAGGAECEKKKKEKKLRSLLQKNPERIKGKQGFCGFPLLAFSCLYVT